MPHKSNFFFAISQFDWPIAKTEVEAMEAPQNRRFYGKDGVPPPLAHLYR